MNISSRPPVIDHWQWAFPVVLALLLIVISHYNFLLFHTLAELFAIGVAITTTVVAWKMYPFTRNSFLMFLGIGYFWVAIIDLFHALSYKGVAIFPISTPEPSIELWLAARHLQAWVLIGAVFYLSRPLPRGPMFLAMGVCAAAVALFFLLAPLPPMFVEGAGLTSFKIANEYAIMALLSLAAWLLWRRRSLVERNILMMLSLSIALTICAELAFTFYIDVYGFSNLAGHIFKFFSFWLIFLAMVQTVLERPFLAMARDASSYDAVPEATIVVDGEGIIRQANQAACTLAERAVEALLDRHCHATFHPGSVSSASCPVCLCIEHGEPACDLELHDPLHDRFFNYALSPIQNSESRRGMVQTIRDITAQKRAERLLKESEHYNRMLFENSPIGLALCRMNGDLVDINPAFARIVGRSVAETLQQSYWDITPERYREQELEILEQLRGSGSYGPYEKEYLLREGGTVPVRLNGKLLERHGETYIWSSIEDITQQKSDQARLDFLAYHDPLTRTPNRLLLHDRIEHALQVAQRSGEQVAVMFIDLDRFKNINDSLGHAVGDQLLQSVASRLRSLIRGQDTLARLGGDEFVILLEQIRDEGGARAIAEKMMAAFEAPFHVDGHVLHLTLSIGISLYPRDGENRETLIRNADAAMYRSKDSGRNSCHFYTAELTAAATERLTLENALRRALANREMGLYFQPQYELGSGRLLGVEALLRWHHPGRGLLLPESFIQGAEESGLIIPMGEWVIASACRQMVSWLRGGIAIDTVAVNVSGLQFRRGNIVESVRRALSESGLEGRHLELEITESVIMARPEEAIAALNELKSLGVMISIDDFGTGYSSLSQLKHLPVDKLKIDRSFVRDIPFNKNDEAIACAIIALGKSLNLRIVAEGIETAQQRDFLLRQGCREGQGYFYSPALDAAGFARLVA